MPLGSNCPKTCTQTQEDEKETRMRGRKRVGGRGRISQGDNKNGRNSSRNNSEERREVGKKNLKDVKEVERT